MIKKARIKAGNDNRKSRIHGALKKWEDIAGVKEGTFVDIVSRCTKTGIAIVTLPLGGMSPCGMKSYRPGQRRAIPLTALDDFDLDALVDKTAPSWQTSRTANQF